MKLLESYLKNCIKTADKNNMRVRVIGDTTRFECPVPETDRGAGSSFCKK